MTASTMTAAPALGGGYRADIDGLRAVSILLVVAFHSGIDQFAGGYVGVDVFFVISGFLVTGILARQVNDGRGLSLRDFYARRVRRLLPLSALVLTTTLVVGYLVTAPLQRIRLLEDGVAAALYVANWRFASQATAYSDAQVTDSLLLHYWSLAIEEQFYLLWPLVIILATVLVRRWSRAHFEPTLAVLLVIIGSGSLTASVLLTHSLGPEAYYLTHTRIWEMALGAGLALLVPLLHRVPRAVANLLAVTGLVAIFWSALTYDAATPFPGVAALVPALGAGCIVAASTGGTTLVGRVLGTAPLPYVGKLSYAWYLWHWPAIGIAALLVGGDGSLGPVTVAAVVVSFLLSIASHHLVEDPLRHGRWLRAVPRRSFGFAAVATAVPVVLGMGLLQFGDTGDRAPLGSETVAMTMTPLEASEDQVTVGPISCHVDQPDTEPVLPCAVGDLEGDRTVAIIGDSHARHWLPALDVIAHERGWRVLALTKSACTPIDVAIWNSSFERPYDECDRWREAVLDHLATQDLDLLLVARSSGHRGTAVDADGERRMDDATFAEIWREGARRSFERFPTVADHVVVFRDTPWAPDDVPACLSEHPDEPEACTLTIAEHGSLDDELVEAELAVAGPEIAFLDPRPFVCDGDVCPMVADDGTIKYRDSHHLTQTFSRDLADRLAAELDRLVDLDG